MCVFKWILRGGERKTKRHPMTGSLGPGKRRVGRERARDAGGRSALTAQGPRTQCSTQWAPPGLPTPPLPPRRKLSPCPPLGKSPALQPQQCLPSHTQSVPTRAPVSALSPKTGGHSSWPHGCSSDSRTTKGDPEGPGGEGEGQSPLQAPDHTSPFSRALREPEPRPAA